MTSQTFLSLVCLLILAGTEQVNANDSTKNRTHACPDTCNLNNGFCQPNGECSCYHGWQGTNCDQCVRSPGCIHGRCDEPDQCICIDGYGGRHCHLDMKYCERHRPCRNGGTCIDDGFGSFECVCSYGYKGKTCASPTSTVTPKTSNIDVPSCLHGGTCLFGNTVVGCEKCSCPQGFVGDHCETFFRMCVQRPCANGGTCFDLLNSFRCECAMGFYGELCEQDADECALHEDRACENGGTCLNKHGSYVCACPDGYEGVRCDKPVQRFTPAPALSSPSTTRQGGHSALNFLLKNRDHSSMTGNDEPSPNVAKETNLQKTYSSNVKMTHIYREVEVKSSHSEINFVNHVINGNVMSPNRNENQNKASMDVAQAVSFAVLGGAVAVFICLVLIVWFKFQKRKGCTLCYKYTLKKSGDDIEAMQMGNKTSTAESKQVRSPIYKSDNKTGLVVRTVASSSRLNSENRRPHSDDLYVSIPCNKFMKERSQTCSNEETNSLLASLNLNHPHLPH